jgi:hypothetical protein
MGISNPSRAISIFCERVVGIQRQQDPATCVCANQRKILLSRFLATCVAIGDEIAFPVPLGDVVGAEIFIAKHVPAGASLCLYQAPIGYATQPKPDKRNELFVSAEVRKPSLGIASVSLPCEVLREYFYRLPQRDNEAERTTLYEILRIPTSASPAELRVAFKLRDLELEAAGAPRSDRAALERAFNIVGQPELRAMYDALLADPEARPCSLTVALGRYLWPASVPAMGGRFLRVASWRSCRSAGADDSTCRCARAISTRIGRCAATGAASSSFGSILPSCTRFGSQHGTSGSIC